MGFLAQFGLLAQGTGFEDWANILFVAVLAILWLLGALVKTISKKGAPRERAEQEGAPKEQRQPGESWQERLARKAHEMQRRIEEEAGLREPGQPPQPVRPDARRSPPAPGGKITVRSDSKGESVLVYEPPQPQVSAQREPPISRRPEPQKTVTAARQHAAPKLELTRQVGFEPMVPGLPPIMAEPTETLEPGRVQLKTQREPAGFEPTTLIDYSDSDALKKAILHYEILGKPLALRDESERSSTF
jgi:hypothetical protein